MTISFNGFIVELVRHFHDAKSFLSFVYRTCQNTILLNQIEFWLLGHEYDLWHYVTQIIFWASNDATDQIQNEMVGALRELQLGFDSKFEQIINSIKRENDVNLFCPQRINDFILDHPLNDPIRKLNLLRSNPNELSEKIILIQRDLLKIFLNYCIGKNFNPENVLHQQHFLDLILMLMKKERWTESSYKKSISDLDRNGINRELANLWGIFLKVKDPSANPRNFFYYTEIDGILKDQATQINQKIISNYNHVKLYPAQGFHDDDIKILLSLLEENVDYKNEGGRKCFTPYFKEKFYRFRREVLLQQFHDACPKCNIQSEFLFRNECERITDGIRIKQRKMYL